MSWGGSAQLKGVGHLVLEDLGRQWWKACGLGRLQ